MVLFQFREQQKENLCGCEGVATCSVPANNWNREMARDRVKAVVNKFWQCPARQSNRAQVRIYHPMSWVDPGNLMIEKACVERGIVCDQNRVADEIEPPRRNFRENRSGLNHLV